MKKIKLIICTTIFSIMLCVPLFCYGARMNTLGTCEALSEIKKKGVDVRGFIELERVFSESNQIGILFASPRNGVCEQCYPSLVIAIFSENNIQKDDAESSSDYQLQYLDRGDYRAEVKPEAQFHTLDLKESKIPILFFTEGGPAGESGNYFEYFQALAWDEKKLRSVFTHKKEARNSGNRDGSIPEVSIAKMRFEKLEGKPDELVVETTSRFSQGETQDKHIKKMRRRNIVERFEWSKTSLQFVLKDRLIKEDNVLINEAQYNSLLSKWEIPEIKDTIPTEKQYTPTLTPLNGNKITIASRVRVRTAPQVNASEIAQLSIGTIIQEVEKSNDKAQVNQNEDYWYHIAAPSDLDGWVFGGLIAPFDPTRRGEIYQRIAAEQLRVAKTDFDDQIDLVSFLKRAASETKQPAIVAELELGYLLALRRALGLIPSDKLEQPPFPSWLEAQAKQHLIFYNEPGGQWIVNSDQFWELHKKYQTLSIGERIAYEGARNSLGGECEGSLSCSLSAINLTSGKYLAFYPQGGAHTEEALTAIDDSLKSYLATYNVEPNERADLRREIDKLRATVMKTSSTRNNAILRQLDQLASRTSGEKSH